MIRSWHRKRLVGYIATGEPTKLRRWCRAPGCSRTWDWDRGGFPCTEPAAWRVWDEQGKAMLLCEAHALAAHEGLERARLHRMEEKDQPR